jgi:hypothetical protein
MVTPVANVVKLFWRNYIAIGITSVKIIGKYAASGINDAQNSFMIVATGEYPRSKHLKGVPLELAPALLAIFLKGCLGQTL